MLSQPKVRGLYTCMGNGGTITQGNKISIARDKLTKDRANCTFRLKLCLVTASIAQRFAAACPHEPSKIYTKPRYTLGERFVAKRYITPADPQCSNPHPSL
jgi:hypothetical protein